MAHGGDFGQPGVAEIADCRESSQAHRFHDFPEDGRFHQPGQASEPECEGPETEALTPPNPDDIGHHGQASEPECEGPETEALTPPNPDNIGHRAPEQVKASAAESSSEQCIVSESPIESEDIRRTKMGGEWFRLSNSCVLALHRGDITKWKVDGKTDAIVNAANNRMLGGGGVDGAIHRAAGRKLYDACYELPFVARGVRCRTGDSVITDGFRLPVSKIIHTVGPIYKDKETSAPLLERSYRSVILLAIEKGIKYLAFPALSCGIYGYPHDEAAEIALKTVNDNAHGLKEVHFVLFEKGTWVEWLSKAKTSFEFFS